MPLLEVCFFLDAEPIARLGFELNYRRQSSITTEWQPSVSFGSRAGKACDFACRRWCCCVLLSYAVAAERPKP
jgi:hypothetical protein